MRSILHSPVRHVGAALAVCVVAIGSSPLHAQEPLGKPAEPIVVRNPRAVRAFARLQVANLEAAAQRVAMLSVTLGGSQPTRSGNQLTCLIPPDRIGDLLIRLRELGDLDQPTMSEEDLTESVIDLEARQTATRQAIDRLGQIARRQGDTAERLRLEQDRNRLIAEATDLERQLRAIQERTATAVAVIQLDVPPPIVDPPLRFRLPIEWLARLGVNHLHNPPDPWRKHTENVDIFAEAGGLYVPAATSGDAHGGVVFGSKVRGVVTGKNSPFGYTLGFDLNAGGVFSHGVGFGIAMSVGPGFALGNRTRIAVLGGLGTNGIGGGFLNYAMVVPVELNFATDLGGWARVVAYSRPSWALFAEQRKQGSKHLGFVDEWENGGYLLFGDHTRDETNGGLALGMSAAELLGTQLYTFRIAYSFTINEAPRF